MKSKITVGLFLSVAISASVAVSTFAVPVNLVNSYSQDFNTLANSGTSSTVPTGWQFSESGSSANTTYMAGIGSGATGDTYSFGSLAATDRALGGLRTGTVIPTFGAEFLNGTGTSINSLLVSYTGEQWRFATAGRADRLDFQYSLNASSLTTGTWSDANELDFTAPVQGSTGPRDGNAATNRQDISFTLIGMNILPGNTFWFRWTDFDATGADDGLAIDDFSLTAMTATAAIEGPGASVPETLPLSFSSLALVGMVFIGRSPFRRTA